MAARERGRLGVGVRRVTQVLGEAPGGHDNVQNEQEDCEKVELRP